MKLIAPPDWRYTEVLGLDIAVGDPLLFEISDSLKEVVSEALEELEVELPLLTESLGKSLVASLCHQESNPLTELELVLKLDNVLVAKLTQCLSLSS